MNYKKTLMDVGKDGAIIGATVVRGAFLLKEVAKISSPIKLDAKNIAFFSRTSWVWNIFKKTRWYTKNG